MKLSDYFPHKDDQQHAANVVEKFGNQNSKKLNAQQRKNLDNAKLLQQRVRTRNRCLAATALAGALSVAGVLALSGKPKKQESSVQQPSANANPIKPVTKDISSETSEAEMDTLIQKVETGMDNLEKALLAGLVSEPEDSKLKKDLLLPFELTRINKKNPNKNVIRSNRIAREKGMQGLRNDDINYFGYKTGNEISARTNTVATFVPPTRTMYLKSDFDPDNFLDGLVIHHELRHVMQDTAVREQLNSETKYKQYLAFHMDPQGGKMRFVVQEEAAAYGYEIEAANILLGNELKEAIKSGTTLDPAEVASKLKCRPDQVRIIKDILFPLAQVYYSSGSSVMGFKKAFLDKVYDMIYQSCQPGCRGIDHFTLGNLEPYVR